MIIFYFSSLFFYFSTWYLIELDLMSLLVQSEQSWIDVQFNIFFSIFFLFLLLNVN